MISMKSSLDPQRSRWGSRHMSPASSVLEMSQHGTTKIHDAPSLDNDENGSPSFFLAVPGHGDVVRS